MDTMTWLVGREQEMADIRYFLDRTTVTGAALVLVGEAGVGKSRLLAEAAVIATDDRTLVLTAGGVEFEASVPYAVLNQLLLPVVDQVHRLPAQPREHLSGALGLTGRSGQDPRDVVDATVELLKRLTRSRPVLLVVDDLMWVDRFSAAVLTLLTRRLADLRVGLLAAAQHYPVDGFGRSTSSRLPVRRLGTVAAARLVRQRTPGMNPPTVRRVLEEAQGNPLALIELPAVLDGPERVAPQLTATSWPATQPLRSRLASQVADLPPRTRELLLSMAVAGSGEQPEPASGSRGGVPRDLLPAQSAAIVTYDSATGRAAFCHPMTRSTLVALSTSAERRAAHARLANATHQPVLRAWHLAQTITAQDDEVAALLEEAAVEALRAGDGVGAVGALLGSAELSRQPQDRARRLAESAYVGANVTGEIEAVPRLMARAREVDPGLAGSLTATLARAHLSLNSDGDVEGAHRLLVAALRAHPAGDPTASPARSEALHVLLEVCVVGGRPELWAALQAELARNGPDIDPVLRLQGQLLGDPARATAVDPTQLDDTVAGLRAAPDPVQVVRVAGAALVVDQPELCRKSLARVIDDGRAGGAVTAAIGALVVLAQCDFTAGRWVDAERHAAEGLRLADSHGYRLSAVASRLTQAMVDAGRGRTRAVGVATTEIRRWAATRGATSIDHACRRAESLAALGQGDFEEAYQHSAAVSPPGSLAPYAPIALWVATDLVEAALKTNRRDQAHAHVGAMRASGMAGLSPRLALSVEVSSGMTSNDHDARRHFELALSVPGVARWPFDQARAHLAYGERLRRMRSPAQARTHLLAAVRLLDQLGARPWADRARTELDATGRTKLRGPMLGVAALTPQEREVALLAASGLSNKEIAERLFLSHRTVGAHLRNAFPKLAVQSRACLRDALDHGRVGA